VNNWRTILKTTTASQNPQNPQNEDRKAVFEDIANIEESISTKDDKPALVITRHPLLAESAEPPSSPLPRYCFVTYTDRQGRLCGGWDDRQKATVKECVWTARGWSVHLSDGQAIPLAAVRCVGQTDEQGALKAAWSVREHGPDGTKNQALKGESQCRSHHGKSMCRRMEAARCAGWPSPRKPYPSTTAEPAPIATAI
jgi:hypothetical protein